jgi:hypothetical protein
VPLNFLLNREKFPVLREFRPARIPAREASVERQRNLANPRATMGFALLSPSNALSQLLVFCHRLPKQRGPNDGLQLFRGLLGFVLLPENYVIRSDIEMWDPRVANFPIIHVDYKLS